MPFSPDSSASRIALAAVAVAVVGIGVAAERVVPPPYDLGKWLPDLLVGWLLAGAGLVVAARRRRSWTGPLLLLSGVVWFVPNFAHAWSDWLSIVAARSTYLHRGLLIAAIVTFPTGRTRSVRSAVVIATAFAVSVTPEAWQNDAVAIALVVVVLLAVILEYRAAAGVRRRQRLPAAGAATVFALLIAVEIVVRRSVTPTPHDLLLTGYQLGLLAAAGILTGGLLLSRARSDEVTDLVVELGGARSGSLRDRLAAVLGDPSLEVGYWIAEQQQYVDASGRPIAVLDGGGRATTRIKAGDATVAVLVHDPGVLEDARLVDAVAAATRLSAANARLQAELRARVDEASESRRRIVDAAADERRRLERRLTDGVLGRLDRVADSLGEAGGSAAADVEALTRAAEQLAAARDELVLLARGIHPGRLSEQGLTATLRRLATAVPVQVTVDANIDDLPGEIADCAWFVCAESLANVVKYAAATSVQVSVTRTADVVVVRVSDDGVGGANVAGGTGLRGLADRVAALGGNLRIDSPVGAGTVVVAELPAAAGA